MGWALARVTFSFTSPRAWTFSAVSTAKTRRADTRTRRQEYGTVRRDGMGPRGSAQLSGT